MVYIHSTMVRLGVMLVLLVHVFLLPAQPMQWNEAALQWADFKGVPNPSRYMAETHTTLQAGYTADEDSIYFEVRCLFHPDLSWTKDTTDILLLNHEQRHFDLAEIQARQLRKALAAADIKAHNYRRVFSALVKAANRDLYHIQELYDKETRHGVYAAAQAKWDRLIDEELVDLVPFSTPILAISWQ